MYFFCCKFITMQTAGFSARVVIFWAKKVRDILIIESSKLQLKIKSVFRGADEINHRIQYIIYTFIKSNVCFVVLTTRTLYSVYRFQLVWRLHLVYNWARLSVCVKCLKLYTLFIPRKIHANLEMKLKMIFQSLSPYICTSVLYLRMRYVTGILIYNYRLSS